MTGDAIVRLCGHSWRGDRSCSDSPWWPNDPEAEHGCTLDEGHEGDHECPCGDWDPR